MSCYFVLYNYIYLPIFQQATKKQKNKQKTKQNKKKNRNIDNNKNTTVVFIYSRTSVTNQTLDTHCSSGVQMRYIPKNRNNCPLCMHIYMYRSDTVNLKSFLGKDLNYNMKLGFLLNVYFGV